MTLERITSRKNPLLQQLRRLFSSRGCREELGLCAADGTKLLAEAVRWIPDALRTVVVTPSVDPGPLPPQVRLVEVPEDIMEQISPMETPQGALFTWTPPQPQPLELTPGTLILDGLQDPGNVGTILRTADAWDLPVVLTPGCADAYGPKTVRASMGAVFRCPVWVCGLEELRALLTKSGLPLYGAALRTDTVDVRRADFSRCAVAVGSEGKGLSAEALAACDLTVKIPMSGHCESLNAAAAAAVLLWEAARDD